MKETPNCAQCAIKLTDRICRREGEKSPQNCPTKNKAELTENALREYKKPENYNFARQASIQESECYENKDQGYAHLKPVKPRLQETYEFARKMGYKRLGLVFCVGLRKEAKAVEKLFSAKGFDMVSVICKVGCTLKEEIGITDEYKIDIGPDESMCNPILQAMVLNDEKTDFNILLGLCVGHDSLFLKYAEAPCTVLAVKDRVLGHNPLAAVYNIDSYYRSLK